MVPPLDTGRAGSAPWRPMGRRARTARVPGWGPPAVGVGLVLAVVLALLLGEPGDAPRLAGAWASVALVAAAATLLGIVARRRLAGDGGRARDADEAGRRLLADELDEAHRELHRSRAAERALREADRSKDEFLATLCHELRNPLAAIDHAAELLDGPDDAEQRAWASRTIRDQSRQLGRLIDDLRDVSGLARGAIGLDPRPAVLADLVRSAIDSASPFLQDARQAVRLDVDAAPIWVEVDPVRIRQVLVNLLSNACRYSDPGRTVTISARPEGPVAVLLVGDEGIGIEPGLLPRIFDMFVRGKAARDRSPEGLGIGLRLARLMVERHGGTIVARSGGPGLGSTFEIRLPMVPPPGRGGAGPGDRVEAGALRLLLVDDNRALVDALAQLLRREGHQVQTAGTGAEAIEAVEAERPDLILLDLELPDRNGIEVALALRASRGPAAPPILALTGSARQADPELFRAIGIHALIQKPVRLDHLREAIDRARGDPAGPASPGTRTGPVTGPPGLGPGINATGRPGPGTP